MIRVENLSKYYGQGRERKTVLQAIGLHIAQGECVVLKGVSGSGKSTLLSLMAGLEKPSEGAVYIAGEPISKLPDLHQSKQRNRHIGFIFQAYNLFEDMSVYENLLAPLIPRKLPVKEVDRAVSKALEAANIAHKKHTVVRNLSGGEKQRCAIARALVNDPEVILCDEPTANLDKDNAALFTRQLQQLKGAGKTLLIATHDPLFETLSFVDRVVTIEQGRI